MAWPSWRARWPSGWPSWVSSAIIPAWRITRDGPESRPDRHDARARSPAGPSTIPCDRVEKVSSQDRPCPRCHDRSRTMETSLNPPNTTETPLCETSDGPSTTDRGPERFYDCIVISDLHLGSDVCQAKLLEE